MMDVLADGTEVAGYRIESLIGRGGMAIVYRAEDTRLGRKVALKLMTPELGQHEQFRQRFVRESRVAASLDHPNIIPIYEAGQADDILFIAMRYVEGSDLKHLIHEQGPLDPARVLRLFVQIGDALDAAHGNGLVHRDVKPGNILLTRAREEAEHVYLTDFGLTKRSTSLSGALTRTGNFLGTIDYVAPEQIAAKPVEPRTDIYALGCVLYECLTGQLPFHRDDDAALLWAHLVEAPPPVTAVRADLTPQADAVVARAMAKAPEERYSSCRAMVLGLQDALGEPRQLPTQRREPERQAPAEDIPPGPAPAEGLVATAGSREGAPPGTDHPSFPPGSYDPASGSFIAPPGSEGQAFWPESEAELADETGYELVEESGYEPGETDYEEPVDESTRPRGSSGPARWVAAAVAAAVVIAALVGAGLLLLRQGGEELSKHFGSNVIVPFSFDYPGDWQVQQSGITVVFTPRADAVGPLFAQKGSGDSWAGTRDLLNSTAEDAVGMNTSFSSARIDTTSPDTLHAALEPLLPVQVQFGTSQRQAPVGGLAATELEGRLVDPVSGAELSIVTYVVDLPPPESKSVQITFFSAPRNLEENRQLFDQILKTVNFFE